MVSVVSASAWKSMMLVGSTLGMVCVSISALVSGRRSATGTSMAWNPIPMMHCSQTFRRKVNELTVRPRKVQSNAPADTL